MAQYPDAPIEDVCGGCAKKDSKPGQQPRYLAEAIFEALTLDEIHGVGGTFAYPDSLTTYQWTCLRALDRVREMDKRKQAERQAAAAAQSDFEAKMRQRR